MNLNQVTVFSANVPRSVEFYKKLGLILIVDSSPHYVRFQCPPGEGTFSIHHATHATPSQTLVYFELPSPDALDAKCADLKHLGIALTSDPADQSWLWREARLTDPDGNPICLFHAGSNRLNPPWRVGGQI